MLLVVCDADHVAAEEVGAKGLFAPVQHERKGAQDNDPGDDEGRFGVLDEIRLNVLEQVQHRELRHDVEIDQVFHDEVPGDEHRKHRGEYADGQRDAESFDRSGAKPDHDGADAKLGDVRVDDRKKRFVVAGHQRGLEGFAKVQFLAHALENQDVGVDRHAHRQYDAGDARQRHGRADTGQDA